MSDNPEKTRVIIVQSRKRGVKNSYVVEVVSRPVRSQVVQALDGQAQSPQTAQDWFYVLRNALERGPVGSPMLARAKAFLGGILEKTPGDYFALMGMACIAGCECDLDGFDGISKRLIHEWPNDPRVYCLCSAILIRNYTGSGNGKEGPRRIRGREFERLRRAREFAQRGADLDRRENSRGRSLLAEIDCVELKLRINNLMRLISGQGNLEQAMETSGALLSAYPDNMDVIALAFCVAVWGGRREAANVFSARITPHVVLSREVGLLYDKYLNIFSGRAPRGSSARGSVWPDLGARMPVDRVAGTVAGNGKPRRT